MTDAERDTAKYFIPTLVDPSGAERISARPYKVTAATPAGEQGVLVSARVAKAITNLTDQFRMGDESFLSFACTPTGTPQPTAFRN